MEHGENPVEPDTILVVGTGAMACLVAARLIAAGLPAMMLGNWDAGVDAVRRFGIRVVQPDGGEQIYPARITDRPEDCAGVRYAIVLVKSWQTARAARQLAECLHPAGIALTLQNGLGNRELLAAALGERRAALGITTLGSTLLGPGVVRPAGEAVISLSAHPAVPALAELLQAAGFKIEMVADAEGLVWGKLVINAAINPLTALLGVANGELLERPSARLLMQAVAQETADVAAALGIPLPYLDPLEAAEAVARRTALNRSSMLQDVQRGAPTEIDAICGAIVGAGEQAGVPTPINRTLLQLIHGLQPEVRQVQPA
jgi:2-dehydropantoate 2-reductase